MNPQERQESGTPVAKEQPHVHGAEDAAGDPAAEQQKDESMPLLKVSSKSNPNAVAGAFAGVVREHGFAEAQVVGAGAVNQAVKAIAIARGFLEEHGIDLVCVPSFVEITIEGKARTAVHLRVEHRDTPTDETAAEDEELRVIHAPDPDPLPTGP